MARKKDTPDSEAPASVTPITAKQGTVTLSDEERAMIRALEANLGQAKMELSNITVQLLAAQDQQRALAQKVVAAANSFQERIQASARAHGISPDDPSKGRWDLNTNTGVFTKVG